MSARIGSSCSVVLLLGILSASTALALDDFATSPPGGWGGFPSQFLPMMDTAGKYQVKESRYAIVAPIASLDHNRASDGTRYGHIHWEKDYVGLPEIMAGNHYFDWLFDEGPGGRTNRLTAENATSKKNCFAYAMTKFINRGTWGYWINSPAGPFNEETDEKDKTTVTTDDVLWYDSAIHASGVFLMDGAAITHLAWKAGFSGGYAYDTTGFDSGKMVPGDALVVGQELPSNWTWDSDAVGAEADLKNGKLRRKKP